MTGSPERHRHAHGHDHTHGHGHGEPEQPRAIAPLGLGEILAGGGGFRITEEIPGDRIGFSLATSADLNGDGRPEILIGAFNAAAGPGAAEGGAVYVVWGRDGTAPLGLGEVAAGRGGFKILGEAAGEQAGLGLAGIGDLNGDGRPEILVGAGSNDRGGPDAGAVYVAWGKADGATLRLADVAQGTGGYGILGANARGLAGQGLAAIGDLNGDGLPEVVVGAPGENAVYVVWGKADGATVHLPDVAAGHGGFRILPEAPGDDLGRAIASIGDLNGDRLPELLVGASRNDGGGSDAGAAYVVWGKADGAAVRLADVAQGIGGFKIQGSAATALVGADVAPLGDLNGDGLPEVLVGAPGDAPEAAVVVWGKGDGALVDVSAILAGHGGYAIPEGPNGSLAGFSVGTAGDLNGDGLPEVLLSAPYDAAANGPTYLVWGRPDGSPAELARIAAGTGDGIQFVGEPGQAFSGGAAIGIGDLDGDGRDELLLGEPAGSTDGPAVSAVYVLHSQADWIGAA
ncbi:VCBS repeat-containing protein [Dankookia rubra]|uniref:VCBS repeat-containing protein n=1 Tax=Dankookia rubra TaxID=1442381 RepID=A0A4R5Q964_9PROT|nr:VCBS repeat-containing protein [Dankookia rubra]TDH58871.1 VCBS repeat-containing protein [Dankookia rubra]